VKFPPVFTLYCLLILGMFATAKYEGWALFGAGTAAASSTAGGTRASSGYYGSHK
jgi:hypothetical protein